VRLVAVATVGTEKVDNDESLQRIISRLKQLADLICQWWWWFVGIGAALLLGAFVALTWWLIRLLSPLVNSLWQLVRLCSRTFVVAGRVSARCYTVVKRWVPPGPPRRTVTLSIDRDLLKKLRHRASEEGHPLDELVEDAIVYYARVLQARDQGYGF
jgi:hypothetical protein